MTYHTYILECADKYLYVGSTNNLEKRLTEHNSSKRGAHYTKIRRPVVLKYSESFETLAEARKREVGIYNTNWRINILQNLYIHSYILFSGRKVDGRHLSPY